jgi:D-alanyl-D-alanine carboxypeptidase/D-alanyl-D-alanine-endopeptidase (penicillin-binding protein 4)
MRRIHLGLIGLVIVLLLGPAPACGADDLGEKIHDLITTPDYQNSRWGILVVDAETGKTVFEHNPDMLFSPASVTKLYSCAAALVAYGPEHQFETPVYRRGDVHDGKLAGDLILVAQGDLTLGGRTDADGKLAFKDHDHIYANWLSTKSELTETDPLAGLKALAHQVKESGIRQIDGDVLIDERLFVRSRGTGSGPDLLTPIVVNDNILDLVVTPASKVGEQAGVQVRPQTEYVQVDAMVDTTFLRPARIEIERVGPQRITVRGNIPSWSKPLVRISPVEDPAGFARALFIEALRHEGVRIKASIHRTPTAELPPRGGYGKLTRVAVYTSPPLSELLKVTLKVSHNLYASILPLLVAVKNGKSTLPEGMKLQGKILADLGVPTRSISLESGAGGGNGDRVTPRATVQLLQAMARRPDYPAYKAGLPVLGVDGTLVDVVSADSPARGKVMGKTGTYGDVDLMNDRMLLRSKSLAGVMTAANGRALVFAVFVNDVPMPKSADPAREGKLIGKVCEAIYQHAP